MIGRITQITQPLEAILVKERYFFKEDVLFHPGKWTIKERDTLYRRELAMLGDR